MIDLHLIALVQAEIRAGSEDSKPETWTAFESEFAAAPFPELVARLRGEA